MMNPGKILLPIKEYSNKFLREKQAKQECHGPQNFLNLKTKKSLIHMRRQTKKNKANHKT